jgi:hypothetical protein
MCGCQFGLSKAGLEGGVIGLWLLLGLGEDVLGLSSLGCLGDGVFVLQMAA